MTIKLPSHPHTRVVLSGRATDLEHRKPGLHKPGSRRSIWRLTRLRAIFLDQWKQTVPGKGFTAPSVSNGSTALQVEDGAVLYVGASFLSHPMPNVVYSLRPEPRTSER